MNKVEIESFKKFLNGKGIYRAFEGIYNNFRFDERPLNQYLEETPANVVVIAAFDMSRVARTVFNEEYWRKIQASWDKQQPKDYKINPWFVCKKCGEEKYISEFEIDDNLNPHTLCKECEKKVVEERLQKMKQEAKQQAKQHSPEIVKSEDFTFFDFERPERQKRVINKGVASLVVCKTTRYLYINIDDSKEIAEKKLLRLRVRLDNITGAIHLVFNKTNGAVGRVKKGSGGIEFNNQSLVNFLLERFGYRTDEMGSFRLSIGTNLAKVPDAMTFMVQKYVE